MKSEKIIVGEGSQYPLNGLLTLPEDTSVPVPAVVFVHGSGASNMDEKVGGITPFKDLAEGLADRGIASVRYDKRTHAHGFKLLRDKSRPVTVQVETIEDALLATELVRADARIDPDKIFLVGHSMGAMLAPRIDAEGGNYRGLVMMAGTPRKMEEVMLSQNREILEHIPALLRPLVKKQVKKLERAFTGLYDLTDEEAQARKMGGGTTLYYFKEMGEHPAAMYLETLEKPLLFLQGSRDFQCRAEVDFAGYQKLMAGKSNATFRLYEGLNHAFVPALYDTVDKAKKEYAPERHIGADVMDDMAQWILNNC